MLNSCSRPGFTSEGDFGRRPSGRGDPFRSASSECQVRVALLQGSSCGEEPTLLENPQTHQKSTDEPTTSPKANRRRAWRIVFLRMIKVISKIARVICTSARPADTCGLAILSTGQSSLSSIIILILEEKRFTAFKWERNRLLRCTSVALTHRSVSTREAQRSHSFSFVRLPVVTTEHRSVNSQIDNSNRQNRLKRFSAAQRRRLKCYSIRPYLSHRTVYWPTDKLTDKSKVKHVSGRRGSSCFLSLSF